MWSDIYVFYLPTIFQLLMLSYLCNQTLRATPLLMGGDAIVYAIVHVILVRTHYSRLHLNHFLCLLQQNVSP